MLVLVGGRKRTVMRLRECVRADSFVLSLSSRLTFSIRCFAFSGASRDVVWWDWGWVLFDVHLGSRLGERC